jgi:hypothetical protein
MNLGMELTRVQRFSYISYVAWGLGRFRIRSTRDVQKLNDTFASGYRPIQKVRQTNSIRKQRKVNLITYE